METKPVQAFLVTIAGTMVGAIAALTIFSVFSTMYLNKLDKNIYRKVHGS